MPKQVERRQVREITREYERKGYPRKRAAYIARATVYGHKQHDKATERREDDHHE